MPKMNDREIGKLRQLKEKMDKQRQDQEIVKIHVDLENKLIKTAEDHNGLNNAQRVISLLRASAKLAITSGIGKLSYETKSKRIYKELSKLWESGKMKNRIPS